LLTKIAPVAHPGDDYDPLPEVPRNIKHLPDNHAEYEPKREVHVREEKKWTNRGDVGGSEGGDNVCKDEAWQGEIYGDLRCAPGGGSWKETTFCKEETEEDSDISKWEK
jgi:hypothetical protein